MSSNTNIGNTPVNQGYVQLIHTGETGGIDGTLRTLYDGDGTASDLQIASNAVKISTQLYIGSKTITEYVQDVVGDMFDTNGSHTNITATYDDDGDGAIDLVATGAISSITGGTGIDATGSGNITIAIDSTVATKTYVDNEVAGLVDSAPGTLDTLNELAAALGDDPNFATTTATNIATKLAKASNLSDLTNVATARTNLGVAIGTNVQAYDAGLQSISGLTTAADKMIYTTASDTYAVTDLTSTARTLLDDTSIGAMQTTLGLGALATQNTIDFDNIDGTAYIDSEEVFSRSDSQLMTATAIDDLILDKGYGTGTMSSWTLQGDSGANRSVTENNVVDIAGGTGISTEISLSAGVDIATINLDASINDLSDVLITSVSNGQVLKYSSAAGAFVNQDEDTGISFNGSTANGLLTYGNSTTADVESGLTYDGSTNVLAVTGDQTISGVLKHSSNGDNRLTLDDDSDSGLINQVTLASVNNVNILIDGTNNGTGDFQVRARPTTANDLDTASMILDMNKVIAVFNQDTSQQFQIGSANRFKIQEEGAFVQSGSLGVGLTPIAANARIQASSHIEAGVGSGAIGLTINDGGGNSNVTFNHTGRVPEQNGNSGRIEVNTDSSGGEYMAFELAGNVTSGVAVSTTEIARIDSTGLQSSLSGTAANPALRVNDSDTGLYRIADNKLGISTAGTFAVAVDASQNVGIGSSSPAFKTTIYSDSTTDSFPLVVGQPNSFAEFVGIGLSGFVASNGAVKAGLVLDRQANYGVGDIHILNNTTTDNSNATLSDSKLTILQNGNVGIGVTDPSTKLEIAGPTRISGVGNALIFDTTGGEGSNFISTINDYETVISNTRGAAGFAVFGNSNIRLGFGTNYTFAETDLFINYTGDVGIGTTSPQGHLDINTENAEATQVYINGEASQDKLLLIRHRENSEAAGALQYAGFIGSVVDNVLTLGHYNSSGSEVQVMHITEGGNVGIGTTTPGQKLDVNGIGHIRTAVFSDAFKPYSGTLATYGSSSSTDHYFVGDVGIGQTSPTRPLHIGTTTTNGEAIRLEGDVSYGATISYSRGGSYEWVAGVGGASSSLSNIPASYWGIEDFSQSNAVRLAIAHTTGNVGIGTSSPSYLLHLSGTAPELAFTDTDGSATWRARTVTNNFHITETGAGDPFVIQSGAGANALVINSSGNVGIGSNSPLGKLHIESGTSTDTALLLKVQYDSSGGDRGKIQWRDGANITGSIHTEFDGTDVSMHFGSLYNSGYNTTTRMTLTGQGQLGIGVTSPAQKLHISGGNARIDGDIITQPTYKVYLDGGLDTYITEVAANTIAFNAGGTERFRMTSTGAFHATNDVVAFSTTPSDKKLKTNVKDIEYGLDTIMKLNPKQYDWKEDNRHDIGFIAQEVEEVIPEIVKDNEWFDDKIKTMDYEKLTAVLIKAVQEQQEQINELKEKLNG